MPTSLPARRWTSSFAQDISALLWIVIAALIAAVMCALALISQGHPDFGADFALPCVSVAEIAAAVF